MSKGIIAIVVILVILLIFGGMYVSTKNSLVQKNEAVKSAWAQVDVVLQRRADLIPNLVETVKAFAAHEEKVFGDIANARDRRQQFFGRRHRTLARRGGELSATALE